MGLWHSAHYGNQLLIILDSTFQNCIAVFRILIGDSFYHTAQMLHTLPFHVSTNFFSSSLLFIPSFSNISDR